jgi:hypothetical protein
MNFNEMQNMLTIAAAPVVDVDAPLPIEVTPAGQQNDRVRRWKGGRHWAAFDADGNLIAVTLYKKGAREIVRRLTDNTDTNK